MLVHRTSAHARAATNGLIGALLLAAVAAVAALTIWPSRAETFGLESAVGRIRDEDWERYAPIVLAVAVVLGALAFGYAIVRARRWRLERHINRVSAALATSDPSMVDPASDERTVASGLPLPRIEWISGLRRGMPKLRTLTATTNVVGWPRLEIAYLRLFNNQYRHVSFVKGGWREFGSVSMLRSAVSMTSKEAQRSRRSGVQSLLVTTRPQLEAELGAIGNAPQFGSHRVDAGPTRVRVRDRYGAYPMRSVLCANATWRAAVDRILETADVVVLDLSGYTDRRAGTRYELQRVLDRVPAERLIFLADPMSKSKLLEDAIRDAWGRISVDSPNAAHPEIALWIARVDRVVKTVDQERHTTTVELVSSRKETRQLMTAIQERLQNARPIFSEPNLVAPARSLDNVDPWEAYGVSPSPPDARDATAAAVAATMSASEPIGHLLPGGAVAAAGKAGFDNRASGESAGAINRSRRAHTWRGAAITFAVLLIGAAIASFVILNDESQGTTPATVAPANSDSIPDCPNPGDGVLRPGAGIQTPCETVRVLQEYLTAVNYPVEIDGRFGPDTKAAVKRFQHDNALASDGLVGPDTWAELIQQVDASS